jgi:very-short-patch-repair endonuclease
MRRPTALPDELGEGAFSTADARKLGVSRRRTRSSSLVSPYFGVRSPRAPSSTLERATAYSHWMERSQFFSHLTAAELHGLRMPEGFRPRELHVASIPPMRAPRSHGVIGHQVAPLLPVETVHGLRLSSAVDTWLSLAGTLSLDDLVVMGDGLVSRLRPLTDLASLESAIAAVPGRRGQRRLNEAFRAIRPNTDSARETLLRLLIVRAGFPEPEVNGAITISFGATIAHGDLVYRDYRTILEYDGGDHRSDERQFNIDIDRLDQLMEEDWRVIRVNKNLMYRRATLIGKITVALQKGGWRPAST